MKCAELLHRHQSSMQNRTIDADGKFGPAHDAAVTSWARPQIPSVYQAQRQFWTATTYNL